ncbi:MAG: hypothetical protein AAF266_00695 [Planctomycetota bacterium]
MRAKMLLDWVFRLFGRRKTDDCVRAVATLPNTPYEVLVVGRVREEITVTLGFDKASHVFRLIERLKSLYAGLEGFENDPNIFNDVDTSFHESFHGNCLVVRDQRGPLGPLGSSRIELYVFIDEGKRTLVVCGCEFSWNRVVPIEVIEGYGLVFSIYKSSSHKPSRNLSKRP